MIKKSVLSFMFLLSLSCLWNTQGKAFDDIVEVKTNSIQENEHKGPCPKERPILIGWWENKNCPEFNVYPLTELSLLKLPDWQEIPKYLYNTATDGHEFLPKLKEVREKISNLESRKEWMIEQIQKENSRIKEANEIIQDKNNLLQEKIKTVKQYNDRCKLGLDIIWGIKDESSSRVFLIPDTSNIQAYLKTAEQAIADNLKEMERVEEKNLSLERTNYHSLLYNMISEKENNLTIPEFEKFYTPEKEKQLLAEYEKAVSEHCVGCDYPDLNEYQCAKCPNRKFVGGECILTKEGK